MTSCFPLASMAQKNPFSPKAAAMVPVEPYPETVMVSDEMEMKMKKKMWELGGILGYGFDECFGGEMMIVKVEEESI